MTCLPLACLRLRGCVYSLELKHDYSQHCLYPDSNPKPLGCAVEDCQEYCKCCRRALFCYSDCYDAWTQFIDGLSCCQRPTSFEHEPVRGDTGGFDFDVSLTNDLYHATSRTSPLQQLFYVEPGKCRMRPDTNRSKCVCGDRETFAG